MSNVLVEIGTTHIDLPERCRLALISDTHIYPHGQRAVPEEVHELFARAEVDYIVHGGDVMWQGVLDQLATIAPVIAVRGNNDRGDFGARLPMIVELTSSGRLIRAIHGHGGRSARALASDQAIGAKCVIYGHSHIPKIERVSEAILVNPGSPSDRRWHPHFGVGFLEITPDWIRPELILFTDPRDLEKVKPGWESGRG